MLDDIAALDVYGWHWMSTAGAGWISLALEYIPCFCILFACFFLLHHSA